MSLECVIFVPSVYYANYYAFTRIIKWTRSSPNGAESAFNAIVHGKLKVHRMTARMHVLRALPITRR